MVRQECKSVRPLEWCEAELLRHASVRSRPSCIARSRSALGLHGKDIRSIEDNYWEHWRCDPREEDADPKESPHTLDHRGTALSFCFEPLEWADEDCSLPLKDDFIMSISLFFVSDGVFGFFRPCGLPGIALDTLSLLSRLPEF